METGVSLEDERKIRVVIIPVGPMSPDKFNKYAQMIDTLKVLKLIEFINNEKNKRKRPKYRDYRNDQIFFEFLRLEWALQSDWDELNWHRRVLGVIGILDCKQFDSVQDGANEFARIVKETEVLSNTVARLCLAVEPGENQADLDPNLDGLVMVPNQEEQVLWYFQNIFSDFSGKILQALEDLVFVEPPPLLVTPLDKNTNSLESNKKVKAARFLKQQGDLCLLAGAIQDASEFYASAVEQGRQLQEHLWVASALEGVARVKIIELNKKYANSLKIVPVDGKDKPGLDRKTEIEVLGGEIAAHLTEAIEIYGRKNTQGTGTYVLKIEAMIKLARTYIARGDNVNASVTIMAAYAESDPAGLSVQQKISLCSSIAMIYQQLGMMRKFAFFLRETAQHCKSITLWRRSHALLKLVAPYYQVKLPKDKSIDLPKAGQQNESQAPASKRAVIKTRRQQLCESGKQWVDIQAAVYDSLIEVTSEMKDHDPIGYLIAFLSTLGPHLPAEKQISLSTALGQVTKRFPVINYQGSAGLLELSPCSRIHESNRGSRVVELELEDARIARSGPFLYKPKRNTAANSNELQTAVETPIVLRVTIKNIFNFPMNLQHLVLKHPELKITSDPILALHLPPLSMRDVDLSINASEMGLMKELILCYRAFNCVLQQPLRLDMHIKITEALSVLNVTCPYANGSITMFPGQHYQFDLRYPLLSDWQNRTHSVHLTGTCHRLPAKPNFVFIVLTARSLQNIGDQEIDFINISFKEILSKKAERKENENLFASKRPRTVNWDNAAIEAALPMFPRKNNILRVPVSLVATKEVVGGRFTIKYGRMTTVKDSQRSLEFGITFNLVGGLKLVNFRILECSKEAIDRINEIPPHHQLVIDPQTPYNHYCIVELDIKNGCDEAFFVQVNPKPTPLKALDRTAFFASKSFLAIEPSTVKRIPVVLPRVYFKDDEIPVLEPALRKYISKEYQLTPEQFNVSHACQFYRDTLVRNINLHWHAVAQHSMGIVVLDKIKLVENSLRLYKRSDLLIEMNVSSPDETESSTVAVNDLIKVQVNITNQSEAGFGPVSLSLLPLVMQATSLSWIGKIDSVPLPNIEGGATINHTFLLCFHSLGTFDIVAHCQNKAKEETTSYWSTQRAITVQ